MPALVGVRRALWTPPTVFDPRSVPGLGFWAAGRMMLNYTNTGLTTLATADGDSVAGVVDLSGYGNHLTQATGSKCPLLKLGSNGIGGQPSWDFDGVDDHWISSRTVSAQPVTAIYVGKFTSFGAYRAPIGSNVAGGLSVRPNTSGNEEILRAQEVLMGTATNAYSTGTVYISMTTYDASGNYVFYSNGTPNGSGTNASGFSASHTLTIGGGSPSGEFMYGQLAEVMLYDGIPSTQQLNYLGRGLARIYQPTWTLI